MFETAELGRTISKKDFKRTAPILRQELLELQDELHEGRHFQIILLFQGVDGGGKGETALSRVQTDSEGRIKNVLSFPDP